MLTSQAQERIPCPVSQGEPRGGWHWSYILEGFRKRLGKVAFLAEEPAQAKTGELCSWLRWENPVGA